MNLCSKIEVFKPPLKLSLDTNYEPKILVLKKISAEFLNGYLHSKKRLSRLNWPADSHLFRQPA